MSERRDLFARLTRLSAALGWAVGTCAESAPLATLRLAVETCEQSCRRRGIAV